MKFVQTNKVKVGVFFGGNSTEHDISIISALQAMENIDTKKYQVIPIYISKNNEFYYSEDFFNIDNLKSNKINTTIFNATKVYFQKMDGKVFIANNSKSVFGNSKLAIDIAFPIVHGNTVEDGALQGFFEILNLPYTSSDVSASAICMDKYISKNLLTSAKIPVLPAIKANRWSFDNGILLKKLLHKNKFPIIIKPVNLGSSIGITKVSAPENLHTALELAFKFSNEIIIEPAIWPLREINCAVLGSYTDMESAIVSTLEEPLGKSDILSFNDKYSGSGKQGSKSINGQNNKLGSGKKMNSTKFNSDTSGNMSSLSRIMPAPISATLTKKIKEYSLKAFSTLKLFGVVRIDYLLSDTGMVYLNEINTIPGSLSFYLWNFSYTQLTDKLLSLALKRKREQDNLIRSFKGGVL
jgi:D-alanine-D-alanine ligase